jgi:hypothetical protein
MAPQSQPTGNGRSEPRHEGPGLMERLLQPLAGEFDRIKATAVGALLGMARDAVRQAVPPSLAPHVDEILNNLTRGYGGEVIRGPVLSSHDGSVPAAGPSGAGV